jgi:methyltransferase FkbM-like protein
MRQGGETRLQPGAQRRVPLLRRAGVGLVRRAKHALPGGPRVRRVPFGAAAGLRIESDLRGPSYLWLGAYEYEIQKHLRRLAEPGGHAYDVGAASGVHTLVLARLTGSTTVAFEADPVAVSSLRQHVVANPALAALVQVEPVLVGQRGRDGVVALDDYALDRRPPTLLKIDVEGAEVDVLRGAQRLLREDRPHVIVETHGARLEQACGDLLLAAGYRPLVVQRRCRWREDRPAEHNRWLIGCGAPRGVISAAAATGHPVRSRPARRSPLRRSRPLPRSS